MHLQSRIAFALAIALSAGVAGAASAPTVVMPDAMKWQKQPDGSSQAVLYGNPDGTGYYAIRLKVPAHWKYAAHHHPMRENVTVISGTFYAGMGAKGKGMAFPAGSFVSMPANAVHYAYTEDSPAVIQIDGEGPSKDIMEKM